MLTEEKRKLELEAANIRKTALETIHTARKILVLRVGLPSVQTFDEEFPDFVRISKVRSGCVAAKLSHRDTKEKVCSSASKSVS